MNAKSIPVGEVSKYIRGMISQDPFLRRIAISGEVSNLTYHRSGHIYFTIKDETAQLSCVMWAGDRGGLSFSMQEGDLIVATGSIEVYLVQGRYQLYAKKIEKQGAGLLYEKFLKRKAELEEMGMFAEEYKRPIPYYVRRLGIVTAPTGAAVQDIRNIALRRNPYVELILYPALVQGEGAAPSIVHGIQTLDAMGLDCLIVGRGGGSIEDLWAFNEEEVARAIFDCATPVISAVGHETDTTIADLVADLRAPTPSAAAELAVCEIDDLFETMRVYRDRLTSDLRNRLQRYQEKAGTAEAQLRMLSPENKIRERRQRADEIEDRILRSLDVRIRERQTALNVIGEKLRERTERILADRHRSLDQISTVFPNAAWQALREKEHRLQLLLQRWEGASPIRKLQQGYAYVEDEDGNNIASITDVKAGDPIQIQVTDGVIRSQVTSTEVRKRLQETEREYYG